MSPGQGCIVQSSAQGQIREEVQLGSVGELPLRVGGVDPRGE